MQQLDENMKGSDVMKMDNRSSKEKTKQKIKDMLDKIEAEDLLNRIYRFIKYIYIHRT